MRCQRAIRGRPSVSVKRFFAKVMRMFRNCWRAALVLIALFAVAWFAFRAEARKAVRVHAVARVPAPVLRTPDFQSVFKPDSARRAMLRDGCFHARELEFVALPGTAFSVLETVRAPGATVYRVSTSAYPLPGQRGLYVDSRFVQLVNDRPPARSVSFPSRREIVQRLRAAEGARYLWGGNVRHGLSRWFWAAPEKALRERLLLRGVDCSGLLYEATGGQTPRNTGALMDFGSSVPVAGLDAVGIRERLAPLDLIAWRGHVIIVLDRDRAIESREDYDPETPGCQGGVRVRPLQDVLEEVMQTRTPADADDAGEDAGAKRFVVRRWYPGS